jgi:hypothetical protein
MLCRNGWQCRHNLSDERGITLRGIALQVRPLPAHAPAPKRGSYWVMRPKTTMRRPERRRSGQQHLQPAAPITAGLTGSAGKCSAGCVRRRPAQSGQSQPSKTVLHPSRANHLLSGKTRTPSVTIRPRGSRANNTESIAFSRSGVTHENCFEHRSLFCVAAVEQIHQK